MNRIKILPATQRNDNDVVVKLAIICPSKIKDYKLKINKATCNLTVLYTSSFHDAIEHLEHNSNRIYHIVAPNFYFDFIGHNANDLAKIAKTINPKSKVYCYSEKPIEDIEFLDLVVSNYKKEDEVKRLIDLLK
jgi:hypothetical protein